MAKLTLSDLTTIVGNEQTAAATINANNAAIIAALEVTLSRDGTATNTMSADIDLNSNDLLNVTAGNFATVTASGAITGDSLVLGGVDFSAQVVAAAASAAAALVSELAAATSEANALASAAAAASSAAAVNLPSSLATKGLNILRVNAGETAYEHVEPTEWMEDIVGTSITGGTQTGITVTYQDSTDDFDFVTDVQKTGTPANDQLAIWTSASVIEGVAGLTFDGTDLTTTGQVNATTFEPTGDTTAADNAAFGYTSTEGAIITGQGTTADFTLKNDADTNVLQLLTGTSELDLTGTLDIIHTATGADDHGLEVELDAAGFGDVKAIEIAYETGAISLGEDEAVILTSLNQIAATGGEVYGHEILATEGSATVWGQKAGALVGPILQDAGTFANPSLGTDNTTGTNVPNMVDGSSGTNTLIFEDDGEYIKIGAAAAFTEIEFIISTGAANPGIKPTFEYSTAGIEQWTAFTPVDGTDGFRNTGVVAWDAADLTGHVADDTTGTFDIRITRTHVSAGNVTLDYAKTAATTVYSWNKDGDISALSFAGAGTGLTGTAASLTAGTVSTITGLAPDTATTQATQAAITSAANLVSVGTVTSGTWDSGFGSTGTENIEDIAGAMMTGTQTGITVTYQDGTNDIDFVTDVQKTGTPANNQIAVWTDSSTLEADADLTWDQTAFLVRNATNDGNPRVRIGASDAEELVITSTYASGTQDLEYVQYRTDTASVVADRGAHRFNVDGTRILDIDDGGVSLQANMGLDIAGTDIITDAAGTATLSNIDALDATTVSTIEAAVAFFDTAGTGLTSSGSTVNVIGGTGIDANANDIAIDSTVATLTGTQTLTNKTLTDPIFNNDLLINSGGIINFATSDVTITHATNQITVEGGDLFVGLSNIDVTLGGLRLKNTDSDIQAGDVVGQIEFASNESSATTPPTNDVVASIKGRATAQHTGGTWPTEIVFSTVTTGNTLTDRWVIDESGHFFPEDDVTNNIGSASSRVNNTYTEQIWVGDGTDVEYATEGGKTNPHTQINATAFDAGTLGISRWVADGVPCARISLGKSRSGTIGSNTVVNNGDRLGSITFAGDDGSGFESGGVIYCAVDNTPGAADMPTSMFFATSADGSVTPTVRMRLSSNNAIDIDGGEVFFANIGTTANAANVEMNSADDNSLRRSTSSESLKEDIRPITNQEAEKVLQLTPIAFTSPSDGGQEFLGLGAQQAASVDPRFVSYGYLPDDFDKVDVPIKGEDGKVIGLEQKNKMKPSSEARGQQPVFPDFNAIVASLVEVVKRLEERITLLEATS
jgi:hypothetical protein